MTNGIHSLYIYNNDKFLWILKILINKNYFVKWSFFNVGHFFSINAFYTIYGTFRVQIFNLPNTKKVNIVKKLSLSLSLSLSHSSLDKVIFEIQQHYWNSKAWWGYRYLKLNLTKWKEYLLKRPCEESKIGVSDC